MISLSYFRQYLWVFSYLFFILMVVAMGFDFHGEISKSDSTGGAKLIRFLNVLVCFIFSLISIILQNYTARSLLGINTLWFHRKTWLKKHIRIRFKRNRVRKFTKKRKIGKIIFLNILANLISLVPVIVLSVLILVGQWDNIQGQIFRKEFFCVAILTKYIAWYLTLLISRFSIFFGKKRLKNLV